MAVGPEQHVSDFVSDCVRQDDRMLAILPNRGISDVVIEYRDIEPDASQRLRHSKNGFTSN